jgi:hypothetical protein
LGGLLPTMNLMGEVALVFAACAGLTGLLWRSRAPGPVGTP